MLRDAGPVKERQDRVCRGAPEQQQQQGHCWGGGCICQETEQDMQAGFMRVIAAAESSIYKPHSIVQRACAVLCCSTRSGWMLAAYPRGSGTASQRDHVHSEAQCPKIALVGSTWCMTELLSLRCEAVTLQPEVVGALQARCGTLAVQRHYVHMSASFKKSPVGVPGSVFEGCAGFGQKLVFVIELDNVHHMYVCIWC